MAQIWHKYFFWLVKTIADSENEWNCDAKKYGQCFSSGCQKVHINWAIQSLWGDFVQDIIEQKNTTAHKNQPRDNYSQVWEGTSGLFPICEIAVLQVNTPP